MVGIQAHRLSRKWGGGGLFWPKWNTFDCDECSAQDSVHEMALVKVNIWSSRAEQYLSLCVTMQLTDTQKYECY